MLQLFPEVLVINQIFHPGFKCETSVEKNSNANQSWSNLFCEVIFSKHPSCYSFSHKDFPYLISASNVLYVESTYNKC